ncbi:UPF0280 family protein [Lutibaculum baratangense]|uniref:Uncharacterized protein n=1 Tax=Lutibaculum baratangense AMV1 TaxID=631454 RepID=V4RA82_9HYPH|nr:UPF0280 family protein [Lutibaculum baratangense]ESR23086.1 hypothetical protein N177_3154 [Lutibaculum baratangense AMV1]
MAEPAPRPERTPQAALLPDGRRLHLQDGPIDLIVEASGEADAVKAAYRAATKRLHGLLDGLCLELPLLRSACGAVPDHPVGKRMHAAVLPYASDGFITPMAAVAGSVADEILSAMIEAAPLARAYVNNGGDIALHLVPGETFRVGLVDRPERPGLFGRSEIRAGDGVRGIATSGRRGRSFSLGIADAVTVLAATAAEADAAATVIANAVDLPGHPAVTRKPARELQPDSDLGERPVTVEVGPLEPDEVAAALDTGRRLAEEFVAPGRIRAAALHLAGRTVIAGAMPRLLS